MPHKSSCYGFRKGFFIGIMQGTGVHLGIGKNVCNNKAIAMRQIGCGDDLSEACFVVVLRNPRAVVSPGG